MDAVKELDLLIEMMRDLLEMPGNPGYKTPEYRKFHEKLTHFIFRNHLDETEEWNVIQPIEWKVEMGQLIFRL